MAAWDNSQLAVIVFSVMWDILPTRAVGLSAASQEPALFAVIQ